VEGDTVDGEKAAEGAGEMVDFDRVHRGTALSLVSALPGAGEASRLAWR
jgi:hypothetical protein